MTNPDTNTLNGALEQLGITMAENLVTQGVTDADPSDGLTTLANKILDITPGPGPTPTPASIDLTATSSILSYADGDSTVLTATVLDSSDNPVEGVDVNFYNGSTSMGTVTTDSSGVATITYFSAGSGDITFTAEVDGTLLTKTFVVHDYLWVPALDGTETIHQVQGTTTISNGEMSGGSGYIGAFDNTGNWELSFKAKWSNGSCGIWLIKSDETSRDSNDVLMLQGSIYAHVGGSGSAVGAFSPYLSANTYHDITVTKNGTTLSIKGDNQSPVNITWSLATTLSTLSIGVDAWGGTSYIKDIVVKPL